MKKIFAIMGIAIAIICGVFATTSKPNVDELNAKGYEIAYEQVESHLGNAEDYEISPRRTVDGLVSVYMVRDLETNEVVANVKVYDE